MKYLFSLILLFSIRASAQLPLTFNKRFVECEDKWVAFQKNKDSLYVFGFIYIDAQAGLTLNYEGRFTIASDGRFVAEKRDTVSVKYRLEPNDVQVAFIPENRFAELGIDAIPEWLSSYKTDTASVAHLYRWGFLYNGWELCAKALTYLEKAQAINPEYEGLAVELAFSYNCLNKFDKAIEVLAKALEKYPAHAYVNKEFIFAQLKSGQVDKAAESCLKAIRVCKDTTYNGENCYNILHHYYAAKDRKNFDFWLRETKKWGAANKQIMGYARVLEKDFGK